MSLYLSMAVFYHCSCVAPSLVKIGKPRRTPPPVVGTFNRGRGVQKRTGFGRGRGPGRTMMCILSNVTLLASSFSSFHFSTWIFAHGCYYSGEVSSTTSSTASSKAKQRARARIAGNRRSRRQQDKHERDEVCRPRPLHLSSKHVRIFKFEKY